MKLRPAIALAAFLALVAGRGARAETLAVVHAKAYTLTAEAPIADATIVVEGGKIVSVVPGAPPPAGARVIDAKGAIVTPGLMNAGTQLGLVEITDTADTNDSTVKSGSLGPSFDVQYALNPNSTLLSQARADGLTRAGAYPGGSARAPFNGQGAALRLSEGPDILDRPRAALFVEMGGFAAARVGGSRGAGWGLLRDALDEARRPAGAPDAGGPNEQRLNRQDVETLRAVLAKQMPLAVVAARESDIRQAVKLGDDYGVKVIIFGGAEAWRAADLLASRHVPVVLDPFNDLPWTFDELGSRLSNAASLARAGVEIAFTVPGIDFSHNAGSGAREAAGLAVANGLPWIEGLRALTANPASIWGVSDHYGTIAPGKDADLVAWDGDPLDPRSAPTLVLVAGRAVSLVTRQDLLRDRYAPARRDAPWPNAYL